MAYTRQTPPSQADVELTDLARHLRRAYFASVNGRVSARLNADTVLRRA